MKPQTVKRHIRRLLKYLIKNDPYELEYEEIKHELYYISNDLKILLEDCSPNLCMNVEELQNYINNLLDKLQSYNFIELNDLIRRFDIIQSQITKLNNRRNKVNDTIFKGSPEYNSYIESIILDSNPNYAYSSINYTALSDKEIKFLLSKLDKEIEDTNQKLEPLMTRINSEMNYINEIVNNLIIKLKNILDLINYIE